MGQPQVPTCDQNRRVCHPYRTGSRGLARGCAYVSGSRDLASGGCYEVILLSRHSRFRMGSRQSRSAAHPDAIENCKPDLSHGRTDPAFPAVPKATAGIGERPTILEDPDPLREFDAIFRRREPVAASRGFSQSDTDRRVCRPATLPFQPFGRKHRSYA